MLKRTRVARRALGAIAVLACSALMVLLLGNCGGVEPTPVVIVPDTPTLEPTQTPALATQVPAEPTQTPAEATQVPAEPTQTPAAVDGSWERIQAAGKLIVGTSADYPPFESYVSPGQLDGFDIALMNEIGRRLGVQVEYLDIAADGSGLAMLQQGQIDAGIAAISRTPEREVYADFTNVYLVGEGAALARQDSSIVLTKLEDVAGYKLGVQYNSVYQNRVQSLFIDTGQMSPDNLFTYARMEHAIGDLLTGRIELVILDAQAAQAFVEQGGVKIVGIGVNQQYYAIAVRKGAAALKAKIDDVITALYNDGTIAALSDRYLGTPQVLPTPTPAPTSVPVPTPACLDGLALVKHLTQEGDMQPGQAFTKGWQVQNSGTCPWSTGYHLVFVDGAKMGGEPVAVGREVKAGETYDVQLNLVSPLKPGDHQGTWQMVDAQGRSLGERLKVTIRVLAVPTATPRPTQTPVPGVQFTVDRTEIKAGECVRFHWAVQNVREVYFFAEGQRWQDHGVVGEGNSQECLSLTTKYSLRVVYPDNRVDLRETTIHVQAAPQAPQITRLTVDPAGQIALGQCVTIRWTVEGDVGLVRLTANGNVLWEPAPTSGNTQDCPSAAGAVAYLLEAAGPGGISRGQQAVNVVEPEEPVTPEPVPDDPVVYSFDVSPTQMRAGECVSIAWGVGGGTTYVRIMLNGNEVWRSEEFQGQQSQCLDQPGDYAYELLAGNVAKEVSSGPRTVSVTEVPPQNPLANTHWVVTSIQDGAVPIMPDAPPTISFHDGGGLDGAGACMTYAGSYHAEGDSISISVEGSSALNCSGLPDVEARLAQDAAFLDRLPMATYFRVEGERLLILDPGGMRLMELSLMLW